MVMLAEAGIVWTRICRSDRAAAGDGADAVSVGAADALEVGGGAEETTGNDAAATGASGRLRNTTAPPMPAITRIASPIAKKVAFRPAEALGRLVK
jgi:hypothetical protein